MNHIKRINEIHREKLNTFLLNLAVRTETTNLLRFKFIEITLIYHSQHLPYFYLSGF